MRTSLLLCCFNRPNYLSECLDSLRRADLSKIETILVVDDASTDPETLRLINEFYIKGVNVVKHFKEENKSIKDSLLFGYNLLFMYGTECVINLDSDALVRNDFVDVLLSLKERFTEYIVTGFNCLTKNRDGSERHKVLMHGDGYNLKASVGGLNMVVGRVQYEKWVKPALIECLEGQGNWDHKSCIASQKDGKEIVCSVPSVCQHIGYSSSMNHSAGGEPPDTAEDFVMPFKEVWSSPNFPFESMPSVELKLQLKNITLIGADGFDINRLIRAIDISCRDIEFGAVKILSHLPSNDSRVIPIRPLLSTKDYSQFVLKEMIDYVETDYLLIVQHDGYILNAKAWSNDFLNYDMVGASWKFRPEKRTSNGGFSCRSRRMCEAIKNDDSIYLQNDHIITNYAEDHVLFYIYRDYLEKNLKVKIAPEEVCDKFSIEAWGRKPEEKIYNGSFGFHGGGINFSNSNLSHIPY